MRIVRDERPAFPGVDAHAKRARETCEAAFRKLAAIRIERWIVAIGLDPATELQRGTFEGKRLNRENRQ